MVGNNIYDNRSEITSTSIRMTSKQSRSFIREVSKHPTHLTKEWVVRDIRTGSRIYYNM